MLTASLLIPALALGYDAGPDFEPLSDPDGEVAFDYSNRCDSQHIPDLATRAFRDKNARVQLIISHTSSGTQGGSRRMFNSFGDLGALTNDCTRVLTADHVFDPASHNNDEWLAAPYTRDGQTVNALVYDEYQPWDDPTPALPDACVTHPDASSSGCYYSSLTLGRSTNLGDSYDALAPNPFVAGIPFPYEPAATLPAGQAAGYGDTSNIIKGPEGYYYAMFSARQYPRAPDPAVQRFGACVMRTNSLDQPGSWIAWGDGPDAGTANGWEVQFVNPYPAPANQAEHVCAPVNHLDPNGNVMPDNPISMSESVTYNRYLGKYMLVGTSTNNTQGSGHPVGGPLDWDFYYSLSDDLVNWETKRLLMNVPHRFENCAIEDGDYTLYSSALDHQSTNRNFETTGKKFYLYFTRYNQRCEPGPEDGRDLVRVPVEFGIEPDGDKHATLEDGLTDPDTGFDSVNGYFDLRSGGGYEGDNYAQATWLSSSYPAAWGALDVNWTSGSDVWYSAGLWLSFNPPSEGTTEASIMQWTSADETRSVGIHRLADGRWELRRFNTAIAGPFTLPQFGWFHLTVHQRLGQTNALNQVFVNGELVAESPHSNMFPQPSQVPARVKFGLPKISGLPAVVFVDRAYVGRNQQAPVGAPPTPEIFTGSEGNAINVLWWKPSPGAVEYSITRLKPNGTTAAGARVSTTAWYDPLLTNCVRYRYVITAIDAQGRHSVVSEPLELMPRDPAMPPCP